MAGLIEWHLSDAFGLQVWRDPARAGYSTVVLGETALDAAAERLTDVGLHHAGPEAGGGARILQLNDPDGTTSSSSAPDCLREGFDGAQSWPEV